MCEVAERLEQQGREEGREEGRLEGREEGESRPSHYSGEPMP